MHGYIERSLTPAIFNDMKLFPAVSILGSASPELVNRSAESDAASYRWREAFLKSYIERDLSMLGLSTSSIATERLLTMCAHIFRDKSSI